MTTLRAGGETAPSPGAPGPVSGHNASGTPHNHLVEALDRAGCRMTEPRRAVAGLIAARSGHFTAADLARDAQVRGLGVGRATVFRTLDLFTSLGLVERVDLPGGEHAYVACDPVHHHHAICTACGRSLDVTDHGLADVLGEIGLRSGFRVTAHRLEIFGLCSACSAGTRQA
jgi:Fur family ferric uptake transcriptional regulator